MKSVPNVLRSTSPGHDDDYFVEIVELSTGKFLKAIVLDTGNGAFHVRKHMVFGDWLVVYDSFGRTLVYSLKTGKCANKFFGMPRNLSFERNCRRSAQPGSSRSVRSDHDSQDRADLSFPGVHSFLHA